MNEPTCEHAVYCPTCAAQAAQIAALTAQLSETWYAEWAQEREEAEARVTALEAECERTTASLALAVLALEHATEVDERHHYDQWWKKWAEPIVNREEDASERA